MPKPLSPQSSHGGAAVWPVPEEGDSIGRSLVDAYGALRRLAQKYLTQERLDHTLQATALVHEAYLRLSRRGDGDWRGPKHFFNLAAREMRRALIDHARRHNTVRRGGGTRHLALHDEGVEDSVLGPDASLEALDEALRSLAAHDPRKARIVELRFFAGMTVAEVAEVLDVAPITVARDWRLAKAWIFRELQPGDQAPGDQAPGDQAQGCQAPGDHAPGDCR